MDRTYHLHASVVFESGEHGGFLFDKRTGNTFSVNATGAEVVKALQGGGKDLATLCGHLAEHFETSADNARYDVERFLEKLASAQALDTPGAPS